MNDEKPRGRPRISNRDTISAIALDLMLSNGWSVTTMNQIARAAEISAPTLFRYFPNKAAVLWHGMDENAERFEEEVMLRKNEPLLDAIFAGYVTMLTTDPNRLRLIRSRITIMEREAEAASASWEKTEEWRQLVISFVASRLSQTQDAFHARTAGAVIWSALSSSLAAWAVSSEEDPSPFVLTARKYLSLPDIGT